MPEFLTQRLSATVRKSYDIMFLERIPRFNFRNSVIYDQLYLFQIFSARQNALSDFSRRFPLYFLVVGGNLVPL